MVMIQKLPKKVREMTVAEFFTQNAAYVCDLQSPDLQVPALILPLQLGAVLIHHSNARASLPPPS